MSEYNMPVVEIKSPDVFAVNVMGQALPIMTRNDIMLLRVALNDALNTSAAELDSKWAVWDGQQALNTSAEELGNA